MDNHLKAPMTEALEKLLNPDLFKKESIFTEPLRKPQEGEKVYKLSSEEVNSIRNLRGAVVDLLPGMGGVAPNKLIDMVKEGIELTSLDYMLTRGCNFACSWCFASSSPLQKDYLPFNKLESITQEAEDLGVSLFVLTGGEPLVYKDPELGKQGKIGNHFFKVVKMIRETYGSKSPKILTFDDVALIKPADRRTICKV